MNPGIVIAPSILSADFARLGEEVRVVGNEEDFFVEDGNATIGTESGVAVKTGCLRAREFPEVGAGESVDGNHLIGRGEV